MTVPRVPERANPHQPSKLRQPAMGFSLLQTGGIAAKDVRLR